MELGDLKSKNSDTGLYRIDLGCGCKIFLREIGTEVCKVHAEAGEGLKQKGQNLDETPTL